MCSHATGERERTARSGKILTAALAVADRHGLSGLTLRMVGAELGADPTAIYRHFTSKDSLVVAMGDRLFGEVVAAEYPADWRERFVALMPRFPQDVYRAHPTLVDVLANQPEESPSLVAINELSIGCLVEAGLDPVHARPVPPAAVIVCDRHRSARGFVGRDRRRCPRGFPPRLLGARPASVPELRGVRRVDVPRGRGRPRLSRSGSFSTPSPAPPVNPCAPTNPHQEPDQGKHNPTHPATHRTPPGCRRGRQQLFR